MIQLIEATAEWAGGGYEFGEYSSESGAENARVGACEEPCGTQTEVSQAIPVTRVHVC